MTTKEKLKQLPGRSKGSRVNSSVRTIKLGQPICPFSKIEMERDYKGDWVPKKGPTDPDRQNCQKNGGAWWRDCEAKGHNPYYRDVVWYVTEDEYDEQTGELIGEKKFRRHMVLPNIKQVGLSMRLNSGMGVRRAIQNKGCKRLEELGFEEVCQYRNCQNPVNPKYVSKKFGAYCSKMELALIAAEEQGIALARPSGELNGIDEPKVAKLREKQLREAVAFAEEVF